MNILFSDSDIIVCIKPAGVLSQSSVKGEDNMVSLLEKNNGAKIYPVHRLDREVSGVMVFAKTAFSAAELNRQIVERSFKKEYIALVHGKPDSSNGLMQDLLFKDSSKNKSFVVKRERKGVKKASLEYELINSKDSLSLVKILLHTGRTHQIRVQFASRGMSLVGDRKYGAKDDFSAIGLWSYSISFTHPVTKEPMTVTQNPDNFIKDYL